MEVETPDKFNFKAEDWQSWRQHFQRFCVAADLITKPQERQVAVLLYCMGPRSEDVFSSFHLTAEEAKTYDTVLTKFDNHFIIKRNIIFERAKFNRRAQEPGETMEAFITALHKLAETCNFGALREELIRDKIVVGIRDNKLSERLQLDHDLTLTKAVTQVRQAKQVRLQQDTLRGTAPTAEASISAIKAPPKKQPRQHKEQHQGSNSCGWCGRTPLIIANSAPRDRPRAGNATKQATMTGSAVRHQKPSAL